MYVPCVFFTIPFCSSFHFSCSFYDKVSELHTGLYTGSAAAVENPLVAFTLIKSLHSEWLNVVYSNKAQRNTEGQLPSVRTHIYERDSSNLLLILRWTFAPSAIQPSGSVTRKRRPTCPKWRTCGGLRGVSWGCRMSTLSRFQDFREEDSRGSPTGRWWTSAFLTCLSRCLGTTASWSERWTNAHLFHVKC